LDTSDIEKLEIWQTHRYMQEEPEEQEERLYHPLPCQV
jgi:hypothetical protein